MAYCLLSRLLGGRGLDCGTYGCSFASYGNATILATPLISSATALVVGQR